MEYLCKNGSPINNPKQVWTTLNVDFLETFPPVFFRLHLFIDIFWPQVPALLRKAVLLFKCTGLGLKSFAGNPKEEPGLSIPFWREPILWSCFIVKTQWWPGLLVRLVFRFFFVWEKAFHSVSVPIKTFVSTCTSDFDNHITRWRCLQVSAAEDDLASRSQTIKGYNTAKNCKARGEFWDSTQLSMTARTKGVRNFAVFGGTVYHDNAVGMEKNWVKNKKEVDKTLREFKGTTCDELATTTNFSTVVGCLMERTKNWTWMLQIQLFVVEITVAKEI